MKQLLLFASLIMMSCVSHKELSVIKESGSGFSYACEYHKHEKVSLNFQKTQIDANEKCKELGYDAAKFNRAYIIRLSDSIHQQIIFDCNCIEYVN